MEPYEAAEPPQRKGYPRNPRNNLAADARHLPRLVAS